MRTTTRFGTPVTVHVPLRGTAAAIVLSGLVSGPAQAQRRVDGRVLTADSRPPVVMELAEGLTEFGTQT